MISAFLLIRLAMVLLNLVSKKPFLPPLNRLKDDSMVSILVKANNESSRIGHLLDTLQGILYPDMEIIVGVYKMNDETLKVINQHKLLDPRIEIMVMDTLEEGWTIQNQMSHQLGRRAKGNYLLFMDVDVELKAGVLETLIGYMLKKRLGMITILPYFEARSIAELITLPLLNALYLTLYSLWRKKSDKDTNLVFAGKRFMLFSGQVFRQFQPFEEVCGQRETASAIAHYLREEGVGVDCLLADKRVSLHGCMHLRKCVSNLSNQILLFFDGNHLLAFTYALVSALWFLPFLIAGYWFWFLACFAIWLLTKVLVGVMSKSSMKHIFLYAVPQDLVFLWVIFLSFRHYLHKRRWIKKHC